MPRAFSIAFVLLIAVCAGLAQDSKPTAAASRPSGKRFFWFRMWPDFLVKFDPVTDTIAAKVKTRHGIGYDVELTFDKKQILVVTDKEARVEVIDLAKAAVVDEHSFIQEGFIVRIQEIRQTPTPSQWYIHMDKIKALKDRFEQKESEWILFDMSTKKAIGKPMKELPEAIRRGGRISPDGTRWHVRGKDLVIVDPKTLKEEGKIELSQPLYGGMGPISLASDDLYDGKVPGRMKAIYTMRDPVMTNRSLAGLIELDLVNFKILDVQEWGWNPRVGGFRGPLMTQDRTRLVTERRSRGGGGDDAQEPEVTLATYELATGRKILEGTAKLPRSAVYLSAVAPDGSKTYFMGRGHEFIVLDARHQYLKTVELEGEIDGPVYPIDE